MLIVRQIMNIIFSMLFHVFIQDCGAIYIITLDLLPIMLIFYVKNTKDKHLSTFVNSLLPMT